MECSCGGNFLVDQVYRKIRFNCAFVRDPVHRSKDLRGNARSREMSFGKRQPAGFCGLDRRRYVRQQANAVALILLPTLGTIPGRVVDFSNSGAWLKVASPFGLPDTFELRFLGQTHRSRIVRRGVGHVGLQFI